MMSLLAKCSWTKWISTEVDKDGFTEVLGQPTWHNKTITWNALRDTFYEDQGLTDFQEYETRRELTHWTDRVAIYEMKNREKTGDFMHGLGRITAA
jgi:hypothetical protein